MRFRLTAVLLLLALLLATPISAAEISPALRFENWQKVYTPPELRSFVQMGDRYWGLVRTGDLYASTDGEQWQVVAPSPTNAVIAGLFTFSGQLFGRSAEGLYRLDGVKWVAAAPQVVAYVVHGDRAIVWGTHAAWQSRDGKSWEPVTLPSFGRVVASASGMVGLNGTGQVQRSDTGAQWQDSPLPTGLVAREVVGSDKGFLLMATDGNSKDPAPDRYRLLFSTDGQQWTEVARVPWAVLAPAASNELGFLYLLRKKEGSKEFRLVTTPDGHTLNEEPFPLEADSVNGLWTVGNERWVAVDGALYRAKSGQGWQRQGPFSGNMLRGVAWGPAGWVAVGSSGELDYSPDGLKWVQVEPRLMGRYNWVTYQAGHYYALLRSSPVLYCIPDTCDERLVSSTDGRTWESVQLPQGVWWSLVAYQSYLYAAADANGIWAGANPAELRRLPASPAGRVEGLVVFKENLYALLWVDDVARLERLMPDGTFTTVTEHLPSKHMASLAVVGDQLVAYGSDGLSSSTDGVNWSELQLPDRSVLGVLPLGTGALSVDIESAKDFGLTAFTGPGLVDPIRRSSYQFVPYRIAQGKGDYVAVGLWGIWHWAPPPLCQGAFKDLIAGNPACQAAEFLQNRRVVGGYPDGTFGPERGVTRAEFAKMLVLAKGWSPSPGSPLAFGDVAGHWAATGGFLQAAVGAKALSGFPDGTFQPDGPITRAQLIKMVVGAAATGSASPYRDVAADQWYAQSVAGAVALKLVGAGAPLPLWTAANLEPDRPVTRAEAVIILFNLLAR